MTKIWKRIAVGAAVVGAVAVAGLLWGPTRTAVAGMIGTAMMKGGMAQMMASHMQGGNMAGMMESHMKSGNMAAMMDGDMDAMMQEMMGSGMMENMDELHAVMSDFHQKEVKVAASALGISTDDLSKTLSDGKEIAEVAKERNVDPALVSSALEELRQTTLADLVTAGTLTQDQADTMLEHMNKVGTDTLKFGTMMQAVGHCQAQKSPAN